MTLRLNDYAEKLEITKTILTRISHHSKNFPKFIPFAMHGELRETHSDEFSKAEINKFIEHEKRADYIIKGHSLPENQRNYFKNATYKNSCIYSKDWIELFNLTSCICNNEQGDPTEEVVIDKKTGNAVDIITTESTKYYYALLPFKTAITLNHELNNLYTQFLTEFDIGRIPNPTNKSLSVSNMPEIIEDMILHCQIGQQEIEDNRIQPKISIKVEESPEIPAHPDNSKQKRTYKIKGVGLYDALLILNDQDNELAKSAKNRYRSKDLPKPLGKSINHSQKNLYKPCEIATFIEKKAKYINCSKKLFISRLEDISESIK